jgi:hypothetical protein
MSQQSPPRTAASPQGRSVPPEIWKEVRRIKEMMLTVHYFPEASWLVAAMEYPHLCASPVAQQSLREAAKIAWQWGAPNVALWLNTEILNDSCRMNLAWSDEFPAVQEPTLLLASERARG